LSKSQTRAFLTKSLFFCRHSENRASPAELWIPVCGRVGLVATEPY